MDYNRLIEASRVFVKNEKRDAMYKVATYLISQFWGDPKDMADALGVLLLTWNQAFYRYGSFDFDMLEKWLKENIDILERLRKRDIFDLNENDLKVVRNLFESLLETLKDPKGRKSPVAVSKVLHLLAPQLFPLWDNKIAKAYECFWYHSEAASDKYVGFMKKIKNLAESVIQSFINAEGGDRVKAIKAICDRCPQNLPFTKSLLKIIDEYNYSKFSKGWIK